MADKIAETEITESCCGWKYSIYDDTEWTFEGGLNMKMEARFKSAHISKVGANGSRTVIQDAYAENSFRGWQLSM